MLICPRFFTNTYSKWWYMIHFIHTADIHFGMENYGKIDSATGIHTRLLDFHHSFTQCIDYALAHQVDFFLLSGDAYKTANPTPTQQKLLLQCLLRLYQANIPVIIIIGNHDNPVSFGKAHSMALFSELPLEGFHVIAIPESFVLNTKSGPVQIVGIPWPTRNSLALSERHQHKNAQEITTYIAQAVHQIVSTYAQQLDPTIPAVLAAHLTVSNGIFSGSEKRAIYGTDPILLPSQLAIPPFDYVALGHLHRYQNLNPHGYPALVYSGSIDRIDFGERKETKGFCDVTITAKGNTKHEFIEVSTRPFVHIEVHLNEQQNQTQQICQAIKQHDIKDAIVKIIYHIPSGKKDFVDLNALQRACTEALHVVNIIPIHQQIARTRRSNLDISMPFEQLLETYFESKPELKSKKETLITKIMSLQEQLEQAQEEGE